MFGYIGAPCSGCQIGATKIYRSFFCGLCNRLRADYGLPARFLVNRDSTFLAIVASARMKEAPCSTESTCCNPLGNKRTHFETGPAVTYAAATTLFGLEMKLRDNATDESGWKRNASTGALNIAAQSFERARNHLHQFDLDTRAIEAGFSEQYEREQQFAKVKNTDLEVVTAPTSTAYARVLERTASLPGSEPGQPTQPLLQLGKHLGALIYLLDAATDRKKDKESGSFNPLFYTPLPVVAEAARGHVTAIESAATEIKPQWIRFSEIIDQLTNSLRITADSVLDPAKSSPLRKKKRRKKKSKEEDGCCRHCDCTDCCCDCPCSCCD